MKFTLGLSLGFIVDGFLGKYALLREGVFGRVQLIRPFLGFFDIGGKRRGGPFLGGKLQAGGGPVQGFASLRHYLSGVLGRLLRLMAAVELVGPFQCFFRRAARLGGIFLLGLPAGHVDVLAGGLVIQRQPVVGHALGDFITGF